MQIVVKKYLETHKTKQIIWRNKWCNIWRSIFDKLERLAFLSKSNQLFVRNSSRRSSRRSSSIIENVKAVSCDAGIVTAKNNLPGKACYILTFSFRWNLNNWPRPPTLTQPRNKSLCPQKLWGFTIAGLGYFCPKSVCI